MISLEGSFPGNNTFFFQDKKSHLQTRQTIYSWPLLSTFFAFLSDFGNGSWQDINRSGSFHQTTHSTYPPPARPSTYVSSVHVETISQLCSTLILSNCQISHTNKTQAISEMSPDKIEIEVGHSTKLRIRHISCLPEQCTYVSLEHVHSI